MSLLRSKIIATTVWPDIIISMYAFFYLVVYLFKTELGLSQQAVSSLEQKEALDKEMLEKVAKALKITPESIHSFNEEGVINVISNTFNSHDTSTMNAINYYPTFNALDKMVELYEALLKSEREKVALLEKMMDKK
ncbi:MAG TPA: transcriptional regulator [Chitinophagaceae bacterium]|nr:transcriptional regulator [Chitinophagaceae bacterium]